MSERQFTEEEKRAAWEKADTVDSPDPGKFRRDVKGLLIERDKYQDKDDRGWVVDEQGQARDHRYKQHIIRAGLDRQQREQQVNHYQQQAIEAGLPVEAWKLFERLDRLEQQVQKLQSPQRR